MRKWLVGILIAALSFGGVAYAADAVAPTIADVYNLLVEMKVDLAAVKQQTAPGASANTNQAGELAKATSADGKVILTVTSVMAGPDATVIGIAIQNNGTSPVMMNSLFGTSLTAGGVALKIEPFAGLSGEVLPNTTAKGVILAGPAPAAAADLTFRTELYDSKSFDDVLETTLTLKLK
jgi:hypothetical protein